MKATKVQALSIDLVDGSQAVLVQDGPEWSGLRRFKCIAPQKLEGNIVVATRNDMRDPISAAFKHVFNLEERESWVVVMSTIDLAAGFDPARNSHDQPAPIARLEIAADGTAKLATMYAPGLPEGYHDVWCAPPAPAAPATPLEGR